MMRLFWHLRLRLAEVRLARAYARYWSIKAKAAEFFKRVGGGV